MNKCCIGFNESIAVKIATRVLQAFPNTFPNAEVVGNPVREAFFSGAYATRTF